MSIQTPLLRRLWALTTSAFRYSVSRYPSTRTLAVALLTLGLLFSVAPAPSLAAPSPSPAQSQAQSVRPSVSSFSPSERPAPLVQLPPGTLNIALLGVDKRPTRNFNNTDVIVIASINPDIPAVTLLSIPRDWPAYIPGIGVNKINTAFGIGGPKLFKQTILHNFGLKIDNYAMVNFEGLVRAVDTLGGVDAIATCRLYHVFPKDPYYMGNTRIVTQPYKDTFTGETWKVGSRVPTQTIDIPKAGVYTLNGLQALAFVRARYGVPGGDVDRGRREQRVVRAIFAKARQIDAIPKFPELLNQFQEYVKTDLPLDKLLYLASIANRFDDTIIRSRFLDPGGSNGAVLLLDDNATEASSSGAWQGLVQQMLSVALNQRGNDGIPIEVWNGTNDAGFGTAAVDRLTELGFHVVDIKAADKLYDHTVVVDYTTTRKGSAIPLLQRNFGLRNANIIAEPNKDGPRYRIIVGADFKTCYYDDSYVLALRRGAEIDDPSVAADEPVTPTIGLTPTPQPSAEVLVSPTIQITPSETAAGVLTPTQPLTAPLPGSPSVSVPLGDLVNVRNGPGVRYMIIGQLEQEQSAAVTGKSDDGEWWQIVWNGMPGWIGVDFVQFNGDPANVAVVKVPAMPLAVVPPGDVVNVRSGPGTQWPVVARLRQRQSAAIIGKSVNGLWWQIRLGNLSAWLAADYVRATGDVSAVPVVER
jgi:anionic cell wall polymer biosynthesis LytR-Cps2A-Psr (LCP) family protein/uncharacterized protein YraI